MAACSSQQHDFSWQDCDDFQLPENSVWFGTDDDGSDIFCGKAWCDGQELPAKIIPQRKECRVIDDGRERVVPRCKKVLVCRGSNENHCSRRRDHCHRRHCHHRDDSSSESEREEESTTTTTTSSRNESRLLIRSIKCRSTETTTIVKKAKKAHKKKRRDHHHAQCWDERRTRMVPKVTVEPRVRYVPKVTMERTVRYEPETYVTKVCCDDSCEPCGPCEPCDPCEEILPCRQESKCKEAVVCDRSKKGEARCVRPTKCDPPSPQPKAKCW
ncbi:uncharacterized protein LOC123311284 [Coccinella septempunctata]|uniref:uncharacterized protein LOC123311284 n=1 Tax=Coccinella septempunctata TaxID=41139 RepID=UPI001D0626C0|nr:uncharacterized protein LOC123311284 [Coccinella septempunctata]